jgi:hypothetical protein
LFKRNIKGGTRMLKTKTKKNSIGIKAGKRLLNVFILKRWKK